MKVDKKDEAVALFEGGDEAPAEEKKGPASRKDHYSEKYGTYKATDSGINEKTGMVFERGCTDFFCVVLFLAFVASLFAVAIYGVIQGEPRRLLKPYDFLDRICGVDEGVEEYGKLYFSELERTWADVSAISQEKYMSIVSKKLHERTICVKACPAKAGDPIECPPDDASQTHCDSATLVGSKSFMDLCVPIYDELGSTGKSTWDAFAAGLAKNVTFQQLQFLARSWKALLFSMLSSLVLSILYIYLMGAFAEYLAWGLIFLVQIGLVVISAGGFIYYTQAGEENENKGSAALGVGIVSLLLAVVFAFALYCGWRQLTLAIEVINCSADFLTETKRLIGVPILYYLAMFLFFLFWLSAMICVESMGDIQPNTKDPIPLTKTITWGDRKSTGKTVNLMLAYLTFGLIWFTFFMAASNDFVTMVTASTFYFSSTRHKVGEGQLKTAFRWAWVHNFGSIAFGSLIIAIIFTVRMLVYYVCKQAEKASGDNKVVKCVTCLVQCFLKCLEEIMEYINKAAYAYIAISGESFCKAALHGLLLQLSHGATFGFANLLAQLFILLGKVGLTVLNTVLAYYYLKLVAADGGMSDPYGPMCAVAITTYVLVSVFLGMFDETVMSMLTCVSADMDLHGGDNIWGPKSLHEVIDKLNGVEGSDKGSDKDDKEEKGGNAMN